MSPRRPKEIRWLQPARDDLTSIVDFIAGNNPKAAERFADRLIAKVGLLAGSPHLGSICPHRKIRQLIHGKYIVYYTVHRTEVVIRAVVHGARLFRSYWLRRDE